MWTIIALLIVAAISLFYLFSTFNGGQQAVGGELFTQGVSDIQALRAGVGELYPPGTGYTGLTAAQLATANLAPQDTLPVSGNNLSNVFRGTLIVRVNANSAYQYDIEYDGLSVDQCVKMSTFSAGVVGENINATAITPPVSPATAITNCTNTSNANKVYWTFNS